MARVAVACCCSTSRRRLNICEKLPNKAKLGLYFNPYGKVPDLIDDCISCGVDKLIHEAGGPVWTEEGFAQLP